MDDIKLWKAVAARGTPFVELSWSFALQLTSTNCLDWSEVRVAMVRTAWDYSETPETAVSFCDFLSDIRINHGVCVANPASLIRWNMNKAEYVPALSSAGVPTVPLHQLHPDAAASSDQSFQYPQLRRVSRLMLENKQLQTRGVVMKPAVGGGSRGVVVVRRSESSKTGSEGGIDLHGAAHADAIAALSAGAHPLPHDRAAWPVQALQAPLFDCREGTESSGVTPKDVHVWLGAWPGDKE